MRDESVLTQGPFPCSLRVQIPERHSSPLSKVPLRPEGSLRWVGWFRFPRQMKKMMMVVEERRKRRMRLKRNWRLARIPIDNYRISNLPSAIEWR